MKAIIINAAVFQLGWLCCVLAGANHLPWLGTLTALLIVAWHISPANHPRDGIGRQASSAISTGCEARV